MDLQVNARSRRQTTLFGVVALSVSCTFDLGPLRSEPQVETSDLTFEGGASSTGAVAEESSTGDAQDASTDGGETGHGGEPGECCEPGDGVGCHDTAIERCVCELDPHCCDSVWDELCVEEVTIFGCGECSEPYGTGPRACCSPTSGPGCEDDAIAACVCAENPYCCHVAWDDKCVNAVESLGCGQCEAGPPLDADCCVAQASPSCVDPEISACVCAHDPYCCEETWDEVCVANVDTHGCGACEVSTYGAPGDCCALQEGPGCGDPAAERCVCAFDAFCCQVAWDQLCIDGVIAQCGGCEDDDSDDDRPGP